MVLCRPYDDLAKMHGHPFLVNLGGCLLCRCKCVTSPMDILYAEAIQIYLATSLLTFKNVVRKVSVPELRHEASVTFWEVTLYAAAILTAQFLEGCREKASCIFQVFGIPYGMVVHKPYDNLTRMHGQPIPVDCTEIVLQQFLGGIGCHCFLFRGFGISCTPFPNCCG